MDRKEGYTVYSHRRAGQEAAEEALSPAGRRMAGCIREAKAIWLGFSWDQQDDANDMVLKIAFQLFNTED